MKVGLPGDVQDWQWLQVVIGKLQTNLYTMMSGSWPDHTGMSSSQSAKVYNYSITFLRSISGAYEVISAARFKVLPDVIGEEALSGSLRRIEKRWR